MVHARSAAPRANVVRNCDPEPAEAECWAEPLGPAGFPKVGSFAIIPPLFGHVVSD